MAHNKISIVEMQEEESCLAHPLILAITKVGNDPDYKAYRQGREIRHAVQTLLKTTGIVLSNGAWIPEIMSF